MTLIKIVKKTCRSFIKWRKKLIFFYLRTQEHKYGQSRHIATKLTFTHLIFYLLYSYILQWQEMVIYHKLCPFTYLCCLCLYGNSLEKIKRTDTQLTQDSHFSERVRIKVWIFSAQCSTQPDNSIINYSEYAHRQTSHVHICYTCVFARARHSLVELPLT